MHTKQLQRTTKTAAGPRLASARTPLAAQPRHCLSASSTRREELAQARATAGQWRSTRSRPQPAQATRCFWESTHAQPWLHSPKSAILGRPAAGGREGAELVNCGTAGPPFPSDWKQGAPESLAGGTRAGGRTSPEANQTAPRRGAASSRARREPPPLA